MSDAPRTLDPRVAEVLTSVGIHNPSPEDPLHRALVSAITRTLGASYGAQLVAMRFEVNQALIQAGKEYATAKTNYEHHVDRETVRLAMGEQKVSHVLAERMARASDDGYTLRLQSLLTEKREQALRKLLDTFASAADNHRTDRADDRAASTFQARGYVPEAR